MILSWILLLIAIICGIHLIIVVPIEEKYCQNKYGKIYQEYIERTPRWIGFPKNRVNQ